MKTDMIKTKIEVFFLKVDFVVYLDQSKFQWRIVIEVNMESSNSEYLSIDRWFLSNHYIYNINLQYYRDHFSFISRHSRHTDTYLLTKQQPFWNSNVYLQIGRI